MHVAPTMGWSTKVGRIRMTRSFILTASLPKARSLCARCKATCMPLSLRHRDWPHDNALIGAGFARFGLKNEAAKVLTALFDASLFFDLHRLPELFCGFARRAGEGPTLYPVACAPQAWAAGAAFLLLQACLGLSIDAARARVTFSDAVLPPWLDWVRISNLRVGDETLDLIVERQRRGDGVTVSRAGGGIEVA